MKVSIPQRLVLGAAAFRASSPRQRLIFAGGLLFFVFLVILLVRLVKANKKKRYEIIRQQHDIIEILEQDNENSRQRVRTLETEKAALDEMLEGDYYSTVTGMGSDLIRVDRSAVNNISEVDGATRVRLTTINSHLYEYEKWVDLIPPFFVGTIWKVKVIPPVPGSVVAMQIWDKDEKYFVTVFLDAYGVYEESDHPLWIVRSQNMQSLLVKKVGIEDEKGLRKAITECLAFEQSLYEANHTNDTASPKIEETTSVNA